MAGSLVIFEHSEQLRTMWTAIVKHSAVCFLVKLLYVIVRFYGSYEAIRIW